MSVRMLMIPILLFAQTLSADIDGILLPLKGQSAKINIKGVKTSYVFSTGERAYLRKLGQKNLSLALKVKAPTEEGWKKVSQLRDFSLDALPPIKLTSNLNHLQWALKNSGDDFPISKNDLTTIKVAGKTGEDVNLPKSMPRLNPVIVAVLDSGIDADHPELKDAIVTRPDECSEFEKYKQCIVKDGKEKCDPIYATKDMDGNGYPMDCHGWNFKGENIEGTDLLGDPKVDDEIGHGTHVSGIIAAKNDGQGVSGIASNALILPVKIISDNPNDPIVPQSSNLPSPTETDLKVPKTFGDIIGRGILYALKSKAQVINMSLAWPESVNSQFLRKMVELAVSQNVLVVASAGNDSTNSVVYPCRLNGVICVGAFAPNGEMTYFSNAGSQLEISAPGSRILSTWPMNVESSDNIFTEEKGFEYKDGTSQASPFVAGSLALLLGQGMSPLEAKARLLAGARLAPDAVFAGPYPEMRLPGFGNLDIKNALRIQPQPFVVPEDKEGLILNWNGKDPAVNFEIPLKNIWVDGQNVSVSFDLIGASDYQPLINLNSTPSLVSQWKSLEVKKFNAQVKILSPKAPGELTVRTRVKSPNAEHTFFVDVKIQIPVTKALAQNSNVELINLQGEPLNKKAELRTLQMPAGSTTQDYLSVEKGAQNWNLQTVTEKSQGSQKVYEVGPVTPLTGLTGLLMALYKIDQNLDGKPEIILYLKVLDPATRKSSFQFLVMDQDLKIIDKYVYAGQATAVPELSIVWMNKSGSLVPAWVSFGKTPENEKPAYDPWNPTPDDPIDTRFYFLDHDGLHSVKPPEDFYFVASLTPTSDMAKTGTVPVMIAKGKDYVLDYEIGNVTDSKYSTTQKFNLTNYRMLLGINKLDFLDYSGGTTKSGLTFWAPTSDGKIRSTTLNQDFKAKDSFLPPIRSLDSMIRLASSFQDDNGFRIFSQSHYDVQLHDLTSDQIASASLRKFSFLPNTHFLRIFFPVSTKVDGKRTGALLIPGGLGATDVTEVLVPLQFGRKLELVRSVGSRLKATPECVALGNPVEGNSRYSSRLVYGCGTQIMRVELSY